MPKLQKFAEQYPQIYEKVTGKGLADRSAFQTPEIGYKVAAELFKRGVLVAGTLTSAQTIRIEPPLIIHAWNRLDVDCCDDGRCERCTHSNPDSS